MHQKKRDDMRYRSRIHNIEERQKKFPNDGDSEFDTRAEVEGDQSKFEQIIGPNEILQRYEMHGIPAGSEHTEKRRVWSCMMIYA
jgi:hypothetical protein